MIRAVLFDLDGTLTDPKLGITRCMQYALAQLGREVPSTEALVPYIGPPLQETFARLLVTDDKARVDAAIAHYRDRFAGTGMYENAVYPGTEAMLAALKAAGLRLFVATSKPRVFAVQILEHFDLARYFDGVYGSELDGRLSDKGELIAEVLRAEGLDPATTLMVGDRSHDIVGGRRAGVRTAAVTYGYGTRAELDAHAPDFIFESPDALANCLIQEAAMNRDDLLAAWQREEAQPFSGWDFAHLAGRMIEDDPPWDYLARAATLMQHATSVVDLDTGGGERFLELRPYWPAKVVVTEEYPPNFELVTQRLAPLGAQVLSVRLTDDDPMPFAGGEFDLVLNRHAAFNPAEVARILAPDGAFLTQQVHGLWAVDLLAAFGAMPQWPDAAPEKYVPRLRAAGLAIVDVQEWQGALRFADVGALVYFLRAVPWLVPGFSVATHGDTLFALQERLVAEGELRFTARKYLIEAHKE